MRAATILLGMLLFTPALADTAADLGDRAVHANSGAALYLHICQACHMENGAGAAGAGRYPSLAGDTRLAAARYPIALLLRGNGAMPWFNGLLTAAQIAEVINHIRTHFGNHYTGDVTEADVRALQGPAPVLEK